MQTIDIEVSRRKFRRELDTFLSLSDVHRRRGIFLLKSEFPNMIFSFSAVKLIPVPLVFAVRINFDNYDLEAPSVRFINPFTFEDLALAPTQLPRRIEGTNTLQALVQKDEQGLPFLCFPGVREYHLHPAHTGNHWLLHRGNSGIGTLGFLLDKLYDYGILAINNYQLVIQAPAAGLSYNPNLIPV